MPPGVNPEIGLTPEGMSVGSAGARDASRQQVALLARLGLSLGHERRGPGAGDDPAVLPAPIVVGVLAAVVQFLGLARWPFLVPALARTYTDLGSTAATRGKATKAVFDSFRRYLGVGIGGLGYLFTGTGAC